MKKFYLFLLLLLVNSTLGLSQAVLQNESFESATIFPAPGWRQQQKAVSNVNGAFVLQIAGTATNPACGPSPGGGVNVMMFNSFVGTNNDTALIITKPFDFSNNGGVNPFFRFYMYRDNGFLTNDDKIRVYVNTVPSLTGATLLTNTLGTSDIFRRNNGIPTATANTWNQYTYDLPAATYNGKRYYFIIMGICKDGNNIYIDQVQTNTYPTATLASDVSINMTQQNPANLSVGTNNQMIVGLRCIIGGNSGCGYIDAASTFTTACKLDSLLLNTNGTTNVLDIEDAKIYYTGGSPLFDTTYVSPFPNTAGTSDYPSRRFGQTIAVPGTNLDFINGGTSCFFLEYDTTYFWLTYDIKPSATGGNFVDADLRGAAAGGSPTACPSPGGTGTSFEPGPGGFSLPGASQIDLPYCVGTYTVGTSRLNGSYTNNDYVQSVVLNGAIGTSINTNFGATNNNTGLPSNLPCLVSNAGPGCDFTAFPPSYELWPSITGRTVVLTQNTGYTVTVQAGTWVSANNIAVFIDYNRDGDFNDAGEKLGQVSLNANQSAGIAFTVPAAGYTGVTRMRVREVWAAANIDPCLQYNYGEIEDFSIIISPNCPVGYKLWLGNTDDWNNPGNWCGGVPTITDDAVVDRAQVFPPVGTPSRPYFRPTIKSAIPANCNNLTISTLDSVLINAPNPAADALKVKKDITINGRVKVNSTYSTFVTYGFGTFSNPAITPFKATATDARTQIIYQASELTSSGLVNGDRINAIRFTIASKGSGAAYGGFTIGYALIPSGTVFATGTPNLTPMTTVYGPVAYSTALGVNTINLTTPIVWDGFSNLIIQYCFDNAGTIGANNDMIQQTQTTGVNSTLCLSTTSNVGSGCALTAPFAGVTDNFWSGTKTIRPNFTFLIDRPYTKANINIQEDWINNGAFEAGYSRVEFDSTVSNTIGGTQNTTFAELQLNKGAANQYVTLQRPVFIDSSLILTQGSLRMNAQTLTMNNNALSGGTVTAPTGPFSRTNGFLISESASAQVIWKNLNTAGWRMIPFGNSATAAAPTFIPYSVQLISFTNPAGLGDFSVSTYYTAGNAQLPPGVNHIYNTTGGNNAAGTVDRFWIVGKTAPNTPSAPVANLTFRFTGTGLPVERANGMSVINPGRVQPYVDLGTTEGWMRLTTPYTSTNYYAAMNYGAGVSDSVRVQNWNWPDLPASTSPAYPAQPIGDSHAWTITANSTPCGLIQSGPTIALNTNTSESCPGSSDGSIDISVSGGTAPYSYLWSNGSTSQDLNAVTAGTYTVTVIDNTGLTASLSQVVGVTNQLPSALTTLTGPSTACIGTSLSYNVNVSSGATTYQWSTPNNATVISGQGTSSVIVSFTSGFVGGNICVSASNSCGNTAPLCNAISSVTGLPASPDSVSGPAQICPGDTIIYSTSPTANTTSYNWVVPVGCSIINGTGSTSITVAVNSSFASGTVSVTSVNACGLSPITRNKNITRKPAPATPGTITGTAYGICGLTRNYSVPFVSGVSYIWSAPSGASILTGQGTNAVSVQFNTNFTNGSLIVVASNACGNSNARTKTIYGKPNKPTSITGPSLFCTKDTVTFSTPTIFGASSYTWTLPSGLTILSGQGTNTIIVKGGTVSVSGDVCVKAGNSCGITGSYCFTINVYPTPNSISGITGSANGVCGSNKYYSVPSQSGITFTWSIPPGASILSGQGTRQIYVSFSSLFSTGDITVTASSACGTSVTAFKTISGAPSSPSSITGPTSICFNAQNVSYSCTSVSGSTSYQWTIPAGATIVSGQGTQNLILNYNGLAGTSSPLRVRSVNPCGQSNNRTVNIGFLTCPRLENTATSDFIIYPNPTSDECTIGFNSEVEHKTELQILNPEGQLVMTPIILSGSGPQQYNFSTTSLADGVYFVLMKSSDGSMKTQKIIVQH
jgi:hypothetical protein